MGDRDFTFDIGYLRVISDLRPPLFILAVALGSERGDGRGLWAPSAHREISEGALQRVPAA